MPTHTSSLSPLYTDLAPKELKTENMVSVEASQVTAGNWEALQWFLAAHVNSVHITPFPARKYHPKTWI